MSFVDLILIVLVGSFIFFGLFFGLVHTLGSLIGSILSIIVASRVVDPVFHTFGFLLGGGVFAQVILFVVIFIILSRLIGVIIWLIEKALGFFTIIPFASTINRLLGAVFGFFEGIIVVGIVLFYALAVIPPGALTVLLQTSMIANVLLAVTTIFTPLLPTITSLYS